MARDVNGNLFHVPFRGGAWQTPETVTGGFLAGSPAVAALAPFRLDVFYRGTNGNLKHRAGMWSPQTWSWAYGWQPEEDLGGNPISGDPSVTSSQPGRLDVVVVDAATTQLVRRTWYDPAVEALPPDCTRRAIVTTQHNDTMRTGANLDETTLTTANVHSSLAQVPYGTADLTRPLYTTLGAVYALPLYMQGSRVQSSGGAAVTYDVLYVVDERNNVYAFDANATGTPTPLWQTNLGTPVSTSGNVRPSMGITSTPVIDPDSESMYVVAAIQGASSPGFEIFRIALYTGAVMGSAPITTATNGVTPVWYLQRARGSRWDRRAFMPASRATEAVTAEASAAISSRSTGIRSQLPGCSSRRRGLRPAAGSGRGARRPLASTAGATSSS